VFVDWLAAGRQRWWQMLPLGPPDGSGSPYNSPSAFAGSAGLVSLEDLVDDGLLTGAEIADLYRDSERVDHAFVRDVRAPLVRVAAGRLLADDPARVQAFADEHPWARAWAEFAARKRQDPRAWWEWDDADPPAEATAEELAVQVIFEAQWSRLRAHAHERGVGLIGDLPIFVSADSADVFAHRELFLLGDDGRPEVVAGVPPDAFSPTGQKWGMPLYDWEANAAEGYRWWTARMAALLSRVDLVRIDHFRGFEAAWHVPADDSDATSGRWVPGPGGALFSALRDALGELPVIAEDLGVITPPVERLRDDFGLPGMKILQFAFGGEPNHAYLPHCHPECSVVYTGTHDNQTTAGWWACIGDEEKARVARYLGGVTGEPSWDLLRLAWDSPAFLAVAPMQDVLGLDDAARFNVPGLADGNWGWRLEAPPSPVLAGRLAEVTLRSRRAR